MDKIDFLHKVLDALEIETPSDISLESDFHDFDEWSSMSGMRLIAMIESEYGVLLSPLEIRTSSSINDLYNIINIKING